MKLMKRALRKGRRDRAGRASRRDAKTQPARIGADGALREDVRALQEKLLACSRENLMPRVGG